MCGIGGMLGQTDDAVLQRMISLLKHRGPDGEGSWISADKKIGFAHKRLAIIDTTEGGSQPMSLTNGNGEVRLVITYNGEIYNFKELREELISDGLRFTTQSDTEVLLHLYDRFGSAMVARLRGMFAFAIWDNEKQKLFVMENLLFWCVVRSKSDSALPCVHVIRCNFIAHQGGDEQQRTSARMFTSNSLKT